MLENLILISGSIIVALIGVYQVLKLERRKHQEEITRDQRYKYFLPFKYSASEFGDRIKHIEKRLSESGKEKEEKKTNMIIRLNQKFQDVSEIDWFFNDEIGAKGGYFITSTIYMNCILFYRMKEIQWKYPFIPLRLNKKLEDLFKTEDEQLIRCKKSNYKTLEEEMIFNEKHLDIDRFIKKIKVAISQANGIPYGLHDSFGDFISIKGEIMNYERFANELLNSDNRKKFEPLIQFWIRIIKDEGKSEIDIKRLDKLRKLIPILALLEFTELR